MNATPHMPLAWDSIDTVLLDLDGTLLDLYFDNHFFLEHLPRRLAEHWDLPTDAARAELRRRYERVAGTLDWYCLDYWRRELDLDLVDLKHEIGHLVQWRPHAPAFLDALGSAGKRRVLATNAHPGSMGFKFDRLPLAPRFEARYTSHDFGAPKEDPAFWDQLHVREGFRPERTLFVDDNPDVLQAARDWGIGHLMGIRKPDSQAPPNRLEGFPAVDHLDALLPAPRESGVANG
jgi:putative hydrolase of the HAD superfamily